jgi:DNA polymerase-3 subunit gamma/tau
VASPASHELGAPRPGSHQEPSGRTAQQPAPFQSAPQPAQAQHAPQGPAYAAPSPPAPVTTEIIQYGWDGVLQALMARRKVAWMVVRTASVVSLVENVLTLQFPRPGEAKGFTSSGYEGLLKEVLHERFGVNVMIRAIAGGGSTAGPGQGARRGAPQPGTPTAQPGAAPSASAQFQPPSAQPAGSSAMQSAAVPAATMPATTGSATAVPATTGPAATGQATTGPAGAAPFSAVPAAGVQQPAPYAAASGPAVTSGLATSGPAAPAGHAVAPGSALPNRAAANSVAASQSVTSPAPPVTSNYGSYDDEVPFPSDDDDPYALDGDEIAGSVDAGFELTGISLIQRDLGAQIIAEYEE